MRTAEKRRLSHNWTKVARASHNAPPGNVSSSYCKPRCALPTYSQTPNISFSLQNKNHTTDALINKNHTSDAPIVVHQSQFPSKSQYDSLSKLSINATCSNAESCGEGGAPAWKRKFCLRNMLNLTLRTLIWNLMPQENLSIIFVVAFSLYSKRYLLCLLKNMSKICEWSWLFCVVIIFIIADPI